MCRCLMNNEKKKNNLDCDAPNIVNLGWENFLIFYAFLLFKKLGKQNLTLALLDHRISPISVGEIRKSTRINVRFYIYSITVYIIIQ